MQRRAFTAIEALMTIGIIAVTTGVTVPVYRNYQVRSELMDATEQLLTAMRVAQLKARAGETAGTWGVKTDGATLFQGDSFAEREPSYDESYPLPSSVEVTGLEEVVFLPLTGAPVQSGEILLTALNGDSRTILIGEQGTVSATGLSVPAIFATGGSESSMATSSIASQTSSAVSSSTSSTLTSSSLSSSAAQQSSIASVSSAGTSSSVVSAASSVASAVSSTGGDTGGEESSVSSGSSAPSSVASSQSSTSSSSSTGMPTCEDRFFVGPDGTLQTTGRVTAMFRALGSQITYGSGGPEVNVTAKVSTNGGKQWSALFNGNDIDGDETQTLSNLPSGSKIVVSATGKYSWMFNSTYLSNSGDGHFVALRDGSALPAYPVFGKQEKLERFLRGIIGSDGKIDIGTYDAVYLVEIGASLNSTSADFQDLVLLVQFAAEPGSCATSTSSSMSSQASSVLASSVATSGASVSSIASAGSAGSTSSSSSSSSDAGKKITICHFDNTAGNTITINESAWPAHSGHGDRRGACTADDDDDGVGNADDFCPDTKVEQPKKYLLFFRNALTQNDSDIFRVGPTKKISSYTLEDTGGCSCEQLLNVAEGKPGYYFLNVPSVYLSLRTLLENYVSTARKYGCSADLLDFVERGIKK